MMYLLELFDDDATGGRRQHDPWNRLMMSDYSNIFVSIPKQLVCSDSDLLVTEIESRVELSERPTTNGPNMELPEQTT